MSTIRDFPPTEIGLGGRACTRDKASMARLPGACTDHAAGTGRQARTGSQARAATVSGPQDQTQAETQAQAQAGPPAQPVAATTETRPKLPFHGAQLPVVALTAADVPQDAKVCLRNATSRRESQNGRPLVLLRVPCSCTRRALLPLAGRLAG